MYARQPELNEFEITIETVVGTQRTSMINGKLGVSQIRNLVHIVGEDKTDKVSFLWHCYIPNATHLMHFFLDRGKADRNTDLIVLSELQSDAETLCKWVENAGRVFDSQPDSIGPAGGPVTALSTVAMAADA
uniref:Uncharacterized protein n=1 Tax=Anguilla anguilla TaxID=7936 RepID=A0A0E9X4G3_ANGAN